MKLFKKLFLSKILNVASLVFNDCLLVGGIDVCTLLYKGTVLFLLQQFD